MVGVELRRALKKGTKIITINPRDHNLTLTAEKWIKPEPGAEINALITLVELTKRKKISDLPTEIIGENKDLTAELLETAELLNLDLSGSAITFDSGFDSEANKTMVRWNNLTPVVYPNRRNTKDPEKIEKLFEDFDKEIYKERYRVERCFAWQDCYRKLVIRYEKLQIIHLGFKYLAYSMINFRGVFGENPI